MKTYRIDDLLEAWLRAAAPPGGGYGAWRHWNDHVLDSMSRCFGVSFEGDNAAPLRSVLLTRARVPHPLAGALEAGLFVELYAEPLARLREARSALMSFYWRQALTRAAALWGDVGVRTEDDLRRAGWDPSREPRLADHIDEI